MKGQIGSVGRNAWGVHKSDGTSLDNSPSDSNIEASDEGSHLQVCGGAGRVCGFSVGERFSGGTGSLKPLGVSL